MLSQDVGDLVHDTEWIISVLCCLLQALFEGIKDALALCLLLDYEVEIG